MVCFNMMVELGFEKGFSSVLLYLDNTSTLYADGNRTYILREKYIALRYFFVQVLVEEGKITIQNVNTQEQTWVPNIFGRYRHRALVKPIILFLLHTFLLRCVFTRSIY